MRITSIEDRSCEQFGVSKDVADQHLRLKRYAKMRQRNERAIRPRKDRVDNRVLVGVPNNKVDSGDGGQFLRRALCITAGDDDLCLWILAFYAANCRARVLIGSGGDGAGIEDNDFGLRGGIGTRQATIAKLAFQRRAVGLGRTAAEVLHIKGRHKAIILSTEMWPASWQCLYFSRR